MTAVDTSGNLDTDTKRTKMIKENKLKPNPEGGHGSYGIYTPIKAKGCP